ncbi:hypothetical protein WP8W19C02_10470 [Enterobacter cloacae]|nr:hypothetical protein WP8W19C02_10470 [Enterobacter cloacae]
MSNYLVWSLLLIAGWHAFIVIMSFVMWTNGYKQLGKGYVLRLTIIMALIPLIGEIIKLFAV